MSEPTLARGEPGGERPADVAPTQHREHRHAGDALASGRERAPGSIARGSARLARPTTATTPSAELLGDLGVGQRGTDRRGLRPGLEADGPPRVRGQAAVLRRELEDADLRFSAASRTRR